MLKNIETIIYDSENGYNIVLSDNTIVKSMIEVTMCDVYNTETQTFIKDITLIKNNKILQLKKKVSQLLTLSDWKIIRHKEQLDNGIDTSLTSENYVLLIQSRQNIRNISNTKEKQINNLTTINDIENFDISLS